MQTPPRSPSPRRSPRRKTSPAMMKLQKLNQEQLKQAMMKKKECDEKAHKIVVKLLDPIDDAAELLTLMRDINQCHYQDIIDERSIMRICGFPMCKESLGEIPKQQFHISALTTKVYDLTDRKNFCSGDCFRSSNYLKVQLLTSPLWMRDNEVIPEFKLMSLK